jgi:spore maturation protein CgeB
MAYASNSMGLGLADFVPSFLVPSQHKESDTAHLPVKPLIAVKRNASSSGSWYCNRLHNSVSNVFCNESNSSTVVKKVTFDGTTGDKTTVVDNSVAGNYAQSSANQSALQDQQTKNAIARNQPDFSVPIQTSKDVNMNVNQQQIEINIKY